MTRSKLPQWAGTIVAATLVLFYTVSVSGADGLPPRPINPTIEDCNAWRHEIFLALQETYHQTSRCSDDKPVHIAYGKYCTYTGRVITTMQAWPECQDAIADSQCALIRTRDNDLPACFAEARANASRVEQAKLAMAEFNEGESQFKRSINLAKDIESAWNDPRRFIAEKVKTKTEEWITENLLDANGRFTERGQTLAQQTYDFIFNRTTGNAGLFAGNPIIAGIQRSAADQIYRAHSQALHELEGVVNQMGELKVSAPTVLAPRALAPKPRPQNASSGTTLPPPSIVPAECAILDGDARTDLAINDPERYERLVARCRR